MPLTSEQKADLRRRYAIQSTADAHAILALLDELDELRAEVARLKHRVNDALADDAPPPPGVGSLQGDDPGGLARGPEGPFHAKEPKP